jgi:MoaA/NifB/PqqE/SkfB family radical SAM enzyme
MFVPRNLGSALRRGTAAMLSPARPILVQMTVMRRCNLACGYCDEYDHTSAPVDKATACERIDHAARLGTVVLTLTGGEPLLHPQLDHLVARVASHGVVCTTITNGFLLSRDWIRRLNDAGLSFLQISVDTYRANGISQKCWTYVRPRLELLKAHARFGVNVNAVVGAGEPDEVRQVAREVREMGFYLTLGLLHDVRGRVEQGLAGGQLADLFDELQGRANKTLFHRAGEGWEGRLLREGKTSWHCRAGARYLYVDEAGIVSYCSRRRGEPGVPLLSYTRERLVEEFAKVKGCEATCAIACARRASAFDEWRGRANGDAAGDVSSD